MSDADASWRGPALIAADCVGNLLRKNRKGLILYLSIFNEHVIVIWRAKNHSKTYQHVLAKGWPLDDDHLFGHQGATMKKILFGFCLLVGISTTASQVGARDVAATLKVSASHCQAPMEVPDAPHDATQVQTLPKEKFRYMDMVQSRRSTSIRNAVIVYGRADLNEEAVCAEQQAYRHNAQPGRPVVIMRPMT